MNVIDDTVFDKCSGGLGFASGDDENGNQPEFEAGEGTDGDDSTSAPIELLAEFLTAVLKRNYPTALELCDKILKYEPNNSVAREFWPLIRLRVEDDDNNECADTESGEEEEEGGGRGEGSNTEVTSNEDDDIIEESEETRFYEEGDTDADEEACEEDVEDEIDYESEAATSSNDGTTDNFSLGDEEDGHSSNNDSKTTDPNGNKMNVDAWQNQEKMKISNTTKVEEETETESATKTFQSLTLEQLRAQFVNGAK